MQGARKSGTEKRWVGVSISRPMELETRFERWKERIVDKLRSLPGDRWHTTRAVQMWVLGRPLNGGKLDHALRNALDRARKAAYLQVGDECGGEFRYLGWHGRTGAYAIRRPGQEDDARS